MLIAAIVIIAAVVVGAAAVIVWQFNRLVAARNRVRDAWAGIDVQLRKRTDLVPQLVAVVDGYRIHERDTLEGVAGARARIDASRESPSAAGDADAALETSLAGLYAVAEAYPDLKANEQFLELQQGLAGIEDDLIGARRYYNALVRRYNDAQQTFPGVVFAGVFRHEPAEYFQIDLEAAAAPDAGF